MESWFASKKLIVKLPPKMGSCTVPEALTRQVPSGSVAGRNSVKPRSALTCPQLVIVVGDEATTGVLAFAGVVPRWEERPHRERALMTCRTNAIEPA